MYTHITLGVHVNETFKLCIVHVNVKVNLGDRELMMSIETERLKQYLR